MKNNTQETMTKQQIYCEKNRERCIEKGKHGENKER